MARSGVTYLDISNAAQQLVASKKALTIENIRIILGTGSNSTLGTHLRNWKATQNQTHQIASKENIPTELIAALKGVWDMVMNQSIDQIQEIQQAAQQDLIKLNQELQCLQKDNICWQQQYQQTKQEYDIMTSEKSAVEQLFYSSKIEIATLIEKLHNVEQQLIEKQVRIDELHRQNQQMQSNLEHYRTASLEQRMYDQQRFEQQEKQLEKTIQNINQKIAQNQQEIIELQQKNQQFNFENEILKTQLNKSTAQCEAVTNSLTESLKEVARTTQEQQSWEKQYHIIQTNCDEQNKLLIEAQTQKAVLSQQLVALKVEVNDKAEQNKVLAHEKWVLGQEKAQLYGQIKQIESYGIKTI